MKVRDAQQIVGEAAPRERLADIGARPLGDRERAVYHKNDAAPVLLLIKQVGKLQIRLAQVRRFRDGAVQPERGFVLALQTTQTARDVAHRGAALIAPHGLRHREVRLQGRDCLRPLAAEHVLAA